MSQSAAEILRAAHSHIQNRAALRDTPAGERSMGRTVAAFNAVTGRNLSEREGWLFMLVLKIARSQTGNFHVDDFEDMAAYAALLGEAAHGPKAD